MIKLPEDLEKIERGPYWSRNQYIYSFTGTRNLPGIIDQPVHWSRQMRIVYQILANLCKDGAKFITGAAPGIDAFVQFWALNLYPKAEHEVIIPGEKVKGIEWIMPGNPRVSIIQLPKGMGTKVRNSLLVARAESVIGFPAYAEGHNNSIYSGTWQTLRMARSAGKIKHVEILNQ